jgi:hypothetical protein
MSRNLDRAGVLVQPQVGAAVVRSAVTFFEYDVYRSLRETDEFLKIERNPGVGVSDRRRAHFRSAGHEPGKVLCITKVEVNALLPHLLAEGRDRIEHRYRTTGRRALRMDRCRYTCPSTRKRRRSQVKAITHHIVSVFGSHFLLTRVYDDTSPL